jgi:hypothetical protein
MSPQQQQQQQQLPPQMSMTATHPSLPPRTAPRGVQSQWSAPHPRLLSLRPQLSRRQLPARPHHQHHQQQQPLQRLWRQQPQLM